MIDIVLNGVTNPVCSFDGCEKRAIAYLNGTAYPYACLDHFDEQMRIAGERVKKMAKMLGNDIPLTNRDA